MHFNDDDDFDDDFKSLEELLEEFHKVKNGQKNTILTEEDYDFLIDYFEGENDKNNAKIACEIGTSIFPYCTPLLLRSVEWLMDQNKHGQALKILDNVDTIDPHNIDALLMRIDILAEQDKYEEAIILLEIEINNYEGQEKSELYLELTELYDEMEEYDQVYTTFKKLLKHEPTNEDALVRICFWADITNNQEDSIKLYNEIIEESPFNAVAWYNLGVAYQGIKLYEKAVDSYNYCLAIDEKFEHAFRNIGDAYIHLKQYDNAIEVLEKNMELGKPEDVILEAIGLCWEKKKDYSKARSYYISASHLSPNDDTLFYKIGETYVKEKYWEKALKSFGVALNLNKKNSTYFLAFGNCLMELNSDKDAVICFLNAVRLKHNYKTAWLALIKGLYKTKLVKDALEYIDNAKYNCGEKPDFNYCLVAILMLAGKTKQALIELENALKIAPKKITVLSNIDRELLLHPTIADCIAKQKRKNKL